MTNMQPANISGIRPVAESSYTVPFAGTKTEAAQEALINNMMGFGCRDHAVYMAASRREHREVDTPGPFSTLTSDNQSPSAAERERYARSTDIFFSVLNNQRRAHTFPTRSGGRPAVSSPEAEHFYRSSTTYQAATQGIRETRTHTFPTRSGGRLAALSPLPEEIQEHAFHAESNVPLDAPSPSPSAFRAATQRIPTPVPRSAGMTSRHYASVPMGASQRASLLRHRSTTQPPRRRYGSRRAHTPPPRLPATYRADTPFSYDRPPTTTPFAAEGARVMTPSNPYYAAPRVGGVAMELGALQRATEGRSGVHRALWPEEREEVLREVDEVARGLVRGAGRVRAVEEDKQEFEEKEEVEEEVMEGEEELQEQGVNNGGDMGKKKRWGWLRKLLGRRKKG